MTDILEIQEPIEENTNPLFQARVVNQIGQVLTPSDVLVGGVSVNLYVDDGNVAVKSVTSLDPNTVYYNGNTLMSATLQTTGWTKDSIGRNFIYLVDMAGVTPPGDQGGYSLVVEFAFQLSAALGSGVCYARFRVPVVSVRSA